MSTTDMQVIAPDAPSPARRRHPEPLLVLVRALVRCWDEVVPQEDLIAALALCDLDVRPEHVDAAAAARELVAHALMTLVDGVCGQGSNGPNANLLRLDGRRIIAHEAGWHQGMVTILGDVTDVDLDRPALRPVCGLA